MESTPMMEIDQIIDYLKNAGTSEPRDPNDLFFNEGNEACKVYTRVGIVDEDDELLCHKQLDKFPCDFSNCDEVFDNLLSHDMHYNSCHRFICSQCKKQFISPHMLDLHLSEQHSSYFKANAALKPMYACFVESCEVLSKDSEERKRHCIEKHMFPHDFQFSTKSKKKKASKSQKKKKDASMEVCEGGVSKSAPTPPKPVVKAFTFGQKRHVKTFDTRLPRAETSIEMKELLEELPK